MPTQTQCPRCKDEGTKVCGGCRNIMYCSAECQQADWPTHKVLCSTFKDFTQRPSTDKCRVVAFLPGEAKPRFMWATVVDKAYYLTIDASSLYPTAEDYEPKIRIFHNAWADTGLDYELQLYFTGGAHEYYPYRNKAVSTATNDMSRFNFQGPLFAFCGRLGKFLGDPEFEHDVVQAYDMDMLTYAHLVAYLAYYYNPEFDAVKGPKVPCVKVACNGDREKGVPSHQAVLVPRSHPVFLGKGILSNIAMRCSLPLVTWKCPGPQPSPVNQQITFMHVSCDPKAQFDPENKNSAVFSMPPMRHQDNVGTQLVACITKRPLVVEAVQIFGDFCQWHLTPYFQKYSEEGGDTAAAVGILKLSVRVLYQITNNKWHEYMTQWRAEKQDAAAAKARGEHVYTLENASSGIERMGVTEEDSDRLMSVLCGSRQAYLDLFKLRFENE